MARDFRTTYATAGANVYAIARRKSDAKVAQTTTETLVTWVDANIANYDFPLTDRGGDLYDADVPDWLPVDDYDFFYYVQASPTPATPAISDTPIERVARRWNGTTATDPIVGGADWFYASQEDVTDLIGTTALKEISNEPNAADDSVADTARIQRVGELMDQYIDARMSAMGFDTPLANMSAGTAVIMADVSARLVAWKLNEPRMLLTVAGMRNQAAIDVMVKGYKDDADRTLQKIAFRVISITADRTYARPEFAKVYVPTYADLLPVLP